MIPVYAISDNLITGLGNSTKENFDNLLLDKSAIKWVEDKRFSKEPFFAAPVNDDMLDSDANFTRLEQMLIHSIGAALSSVDVSLDDSKTLLLISTTKGNIDLFDPTLQSKFGKSRLYLSGMAKQIGHHFKAKQTPVVICNACISGTLAIATGARLIRSGAYDHVVVAGGDILSIFTSSGFQSFKALSKNPCRPYDASRDGLNLGEGAATIVLSKHRTKNGGIEILGGGSSNDANHISGPSRTGEGLSRAIRLALEESNVTAKEIAFISAHGTATMYNDEMESKAFHAEGLNEVPVNSLKGYFGHTLGASGTLESVITMESMRRQKMIASKGILEPGVSMPLAILDQHKKGTIPFALKTASGFGGCNAAVVLKYE